MTLALLERRSSFGFLEGGGEAMVGALGEAMVWRCESLFGSQLTCERWNELKKNSDEN